MIYFVRHGQTDYNVQGICAGQRDIPLNETGVQQAKLLAEKLKDVHFDFCFCSPLLRAKQTCAEILKYHPDLTPVYEERIRERAFGQAEGQSRTKIQTHFWQVNERLEETKALGIETIPEILARVADFYEELKPQADKNILVVAHAGIGKATSAYFHGIPASGNLSEISIPNAEEMKFIYQ